MSGLDAINRMLKKMYGSYIAADIHGVLDEYLDYAEAKRLRKASTRHFRLARGRVSRRRRAAYIGLARRERRLANEAIDRATAPKKIRLPSPLMMRWPR